MRKSFVAAQIRPDAAEEADNKRSRKKIGEGFGAILHQRRTTRGPWSPSDGHRNRGGDTV